MTLSRIEKNRPLPCPTCRNILVSVGICPDLRPSSHSTDRYAYLPDRRENFSPAIRLKLGQPFDVSSHDDLSVRALLGVHPRLHDPARPSVQSRSVYSRTISPQSASKYQVALPWNLAAHWRHSSNQTDRHRLQAARRKGRRAPPKLLELRHWRARSVQDASRS